MAERLRTDTATMLRVIRGMGFPGYPEFRRYLHELTIAHATSLDSMMGSAATDSDIPSHVRDSLDRDQKNFANLRNSLDTRRLARLAQRIWSARRVILLGGDLASALIFYLEHHLVILGLPVFSATSPGRVVHLVRTAKGAHCVGITDTFVSPIARFADECFIVSVETCHFGDSYVGPMALLDVMLVACANYRRRHALALVREAAQEQQRGFRWYED